MMILEIYIENKYSTMLKSYEDFSNNLKKFYQKNAWELLHETNMFPLHRVMATLSEIILFFHFLGVIRLSFHFLEIPSSLRNFWPRQLYVHSSLDTLYIHLQALFWYMMQKEFSFIARSFSQ